MDIDKIRHSKEEIKADFWSPNYLKNPNKKLRHFYDENVAYWIDNAKTLREVFPKETNIFLASIYKSNFTYKFISENALVLNQQKFSINEKIKFLKNVFENSYHYFGFITICSKYNKRYVNSLFKKWYLPDLANEYSKIKKDKPWRNAKKEIISGKKWILQNCSFFDFSPIDVDILSLIRNAESHEKLVVTKTQLIILGKKPIHLSIKQLNDLFKYVKYSVSLAIHFNVLLALKYNFWFIPALIIGNPEKFNVKFSKIPKFPTKDEKRQFPKKKKKNAFKNAEEKMQYHAGIFFNFFEYLFKGIWQDILSDGPAINKFLNSYQLRFDDNKFKQLHSEAILETLKVLIVSNDYLKSDILLMTIDKTSFEVTPENITEFDYLAFFDDLRATLIKVKSVDFDKKFKAFMHLLLSGMISLTSPFYKIKESFNQILIQDN